MVKFRGIEISIISQFDIRKLPEFRYSQTSLLNDCPTDKIDSTRAIASCYVPIYAGSQIWFEYSVDGPHPPGGGYFFKLLLDGKVVTSWDCTEKHDYHGKMMYNIICEKKDHFSDKHAMVRQAFTFSSQIDEDTQPNEQTDVVEIRVHRIEHRQRVRKLEIGVGGNDIGNTSNNSIQLPDGGLLEPGFPHRRYKYQLLDPVDDPYATFRFYYRTLDFLKRQGIVDSSPINISSLISTPTFNDISSIIHPSSDSNNEKCNDEDGVLPSSPSSGFDTAVVKPASMSGQVYIPPSDSEESLSIVTRDSIEDLPPSIPRSPRSPKSPKKSTQTFDEILNNPESESVPPPSPTKSPLSPRRLLKKNMTVKINGTEFNVDRKKRPLSPFTSGGTLRKLMPASAPSNATEFGPTVKDEVEKLEERMRKSKTERSQSTAVKRTTRAERGGSQLMGFLARRLRNRS